MNRTAAVAFFVVSVSGPCLAERWKAHDEFISFETPEGGQFAIEKSKLKFRLASWRSNDGETQITIDALPQPASFKPDLDRMVYLLGRGGRKAEKLPTRKIGGHELWVVKTSSSKLIEYRVSVFHHDWVHRMKISGPSTAETEKFAKRLLESIEIKEGEWEPLADKPEKVRD